MKLYLILEVKTEGDAFQVVHACRRHQTINAGKLEHAELEKDIEGRNKEPTKVVRRLYP